MIELNFITIVSLNLALCVHLPRVYLIHPRKQYILYSPILKGVADRGYTGSTHESKFINIIHTHMMNTGPVCNGKITWQSPKLRNIISSLKGIENRIHVCTYGFIVKNFQT